MFVWFVCVCICLSKSGVDLGYMMLKKYDLVVEIHLNCSHEKVRILYYLIKKIKSYKSLSVCAVRENDMCFVFRDTHKTDFHCLSKKLKCVIAILKVLGVIVKWVQKRMTNIF